MPRPRLPLPLIGVLLVACGAHDDEAPVHPDPAPRCRRLQDRMPRLLAALDAGGARRLKASLEEALDEAAAGRLVEIVMALVRALPEDLGWTERAPGGLPVELLGELLRGVARSPDLDALGRTLGPVLDQCNLAPVLHAGAAILRDPRAPDVLAALSASAQDRAAITSLRAALLATPDQRRGWPHLAAPLICQLRDTTNELEALRQFLVPLLGERAKQPPLSEAVDGLIDLLAPESEGRRYAAEWVGCYVGRPPGPDAFSCPYPLPELSPDRDGVLLRMLWDVLSAVTEAAPTRPTEATPDADVLATGADILDALAAEPHLGRAWADLLSALLTATEAAGALEDLAGLVENGALEELLDALTAATAGCDP